MEPIRKSLFSKPKQSYMPRAETFAITVDGYDTKRVPNVVMGTRIDSQEKVIVSLREIEQTGRFKRSEISTFAAPRKDRNHPGTAIGGTLLIQEAIPQEDGTFAARWIQSLSHTPGEAEVFVATAHVTPLRRGAGDKQYSIMTILHDGNFGNISQEAAEALKLTPPFRVSNTQELEESVLSLIEENVGVGVRVSNAESFDAMYVTRQKGATPVQSTAAFMANIKDIAPAIDSGELKCEVIPYGNIFAGPATVAVMAENSVAQSRLDRFNIETAAESGKIYTTSIYHPTIVAVRLTQPDDNGNRAVLFTHFEPIKTRQPIATLTNALAHAQTEWLAPEPPRPASPAAAPAAASAPAPAAFAADAPDSGFGGSFDGGLDDDLMESAQSFGAASDIGESQPEAPSAPAPAPAPAPTARRYAGRRTA